MYTLDADMNEFQWTDLVSQSTEAMSLLTAALNLHMNVHQHLIINTPAIWIDVKNTSILNQSFEQIENNRISFPKGFQTENLTNETTISFRVCFVHHLRFSYFC